MTDEIDESLDWLGNEVDCASCPHEPMLAAGRCALKHSCVNDRYARRIDRFFNWNPDLANSYVTHPHFEVRAIAAKHADIFQLPPLLDDPEEAVRWNAARRLPKRYVLRLRTDPHREVRIRVVSLLEDAELIPMMSDPDYYVRLVIARRVTPALLVRMIFDDEVEVRRVVARRIQHVMRWRAGFPCPKLLNCWTTPIYLCGKWCWHAWCVSRNRRGVCWYEQYRSRQ